MTPSRLYHRRPACVLVSAPTTTLPVQYEERCSWSAASFGLPAGSHRESGSNVRPLWRSKPAPGDTQARRRCCFGLTAVPTSSLKEPEKLTALSPSTWCVIPPCPSSKGLNYRAKRPALLLCFSDETTSGTLLLTKKDSLQAEFLPSFHFLRFRNSRFFRVLPFRRSRGQRFPAKMFKKTLNNSRQGPLASFKPCVVLH